MQDVARLIAFQILVEVILVVQPVASGFFTTLFLMFTH